MSGSHPPWRTKLFYTNYGNQSSIYSTFSELCWCGADLFSVRFVLFVLLNKSFNMYTRGDFHERSSTVKAASKAPGRIFSTFTPRFGFNGSIPSVSSDQYLRCSWIIYWCWSYLQPVNNSDWKPQSCWGFLDYYLLVN